MSSLFDSAQGSRRRGQGVRVRVAGRVIALALGVLFGVLSIDVHASLPTYTSSHSLTFLPEKLRGALYPGGLIALATRVTNSNPYGVRVGPIQLAPGRGTGGGISVDRRHAACNVHSLSLVVPRDDREGIAVPGHSSVTVYTSIAMDRSANNRCQGATFRFFLTATAGPTFFS